MNTKGIGEHMSLIGLSTKTEDQTHPAKSTRPEPSVVRPDYLVVGGGFLPSQTNFSGSSGGSSLPQPDPPDPTVMLVLSRHKGLFAFGKLVLRLECQTR